MANRKTSRILITAGPTREKIDPVRFISNYSTGTFGYALAGEAGRRGYSVTLISGPVQLAKPKGVKLIKVESAVEMMKAALKETRTADCVIMAAAVSDWRPEQASRSKIKKTSGQAVIKLVRNPDILKELGKRKNGKILAGFALETEGLVKNAVKKLKEKNLDFIVANRLDRKTGVFGEIPVKITIIDRFGLKQRFCAPSKAKAAKIILDKVSSFNI